MRNALVASIRRHGHRAGVAAKLRWTALPECDPGACSSPAAMVVCLGAGDITRYAGDLASKLETA
jgi:UDP-N-acetylmuramate--alanine ligase